MGQRQWRSGLFVARHVTRAWQHWFNLTILRVPIRSVEEEKFRRCAILHISVFSMALG